MPNSSGSGGSYVLVWLLCGILIHYVYSRLQRKSLLLPPGVLLGIHQQYRKVSDGSEHGHRVIYGCNTKPYFLPTKELQSTLSKFVLPSGTQPMQIPENLEWHS